MPLDLRRDNYEIGNEELLNWPDQSRIRPHVFGFVRLSFNLKLQSSRGAWSTFMCIKKCFEFHGAVLWNGLPLDMSRVHENPAISVKSY